MQPHEVEYYRARAAAERRLAKGSENEDVAAIHEELAIQYEALVMQDAANCRAAAGIVQPTSQRRIRSVQLSGAGVNSIGPG